MHPMLHSIPLALAVAEKAIREFSNQWLAGLQPQLSLETAPDGQIWVNSRVAAGDVPTPPELQLLFIMLKKPMVIAKLQKLHNHIAPAEKAPPIAGVS